MYKTAKSSILHMFFAVVCHMKYICYTPVTLTLAYQIEVIEKNKGADQPRNLLLRPDLSDIKRV